MDDTISLIASDGVDLNAETSAGTEGTTTTAPEYWQEYITKQDEYFTMLLVMLSLIIGLLLCLILKRR